MLALDHPGEAPYLQLPDGRVSVYGIDITAVWNRTLQEAVYRMRVSDILAAVRELYPQLVQEFSAPFNTMHYVTIGHSLGGVAAAGALAIEELIIWGREFAWVVR